MVDESSKTEDKYKKLLEEHNKLLAEHAALREQAQRLEAQLSAATLRLEERPEAAEPSWLKKWLFTTDHKEVGLLYFVTALWFLLIGGTLAMLMRTQLAFPAPFSFLTGAAYNQAVSTHGLIMVLWFLSPLGAAFTNYFLPLQIGATDVAFPRFNAFSYWMYVFSGFVFISGYFVPGGAAAGGWTNYAPLNSIIFQPGGGESLAGLGLLMMWGSLAMGSVNLILTVLIMRAPGITWSKVPLFTWFALVTQVMLLYSVPSIFAGTLALVLDRTLGTVFFVSSGGSSVLWDHMWWFFAHPEVYVVVLPAFGVVAEVFQVFSGRPLYAKRAMLVSLGLILLPFSFSIYAHHMFLTGINTVERELITLNTEVNTLPSGLIVIAMLLTVVGGSIKFKAPMLFAIGSIAVFVIGGLSGVFDSSVFLDTQLRGTYQVVSHFHYIMVGASEFGLFAAIYYYLPRWTGRMYSGAIAKLHFITSFAFFNMIFFPMLYLLDMPRRIFTYLPSTGWGGPNFIATLGAYGFGISQILLLYIMVQAVRGKGQRAPMNPWKASTPEWTMDPKAYAEQYPSVFASTPPRTNPDGGYFTHPSTPLNSSPFTISLGLAVAFIGLVVSLPIALVGAVIGFYGVYTWIKDDLRGRFRMPEEEVAGETWPFKPDPEMEFGVWKIKMGVWLFLASDIVFFAAFIGNYLFIRENVPKWPLPGSVLDIPVGVVNTVILITSALTAVLAYQAIKDGNRKRMLTLMVVTLILGGAYLEITGLEWISLFSKGFTLSSGLPGSTYYYMAGVSAVHILAGLVILTYLIKKTLNGGLTKNNHHQLEWFGLLWAFIVLVWIFMFPLLYLV